MVWLGEMEWGRRHYFAHYHGDYIDFESYNYNSGNDIKI